MRGYKRGRGPAAARAALLALGYATAGMTTHHLATPAVGQITASWLNDVSGTWTNPTAWSTPVYPNNDTPNPGDAYDVIIDATGNNYSITLDSDVTINSLLINSPNATLTQLLGVLTLVNGGTVASGVYHLYGGMLTGGGTFTINSAMEWGSGTMAGTGRTVVASGGVISAWSSQSRTLARILDNSGTFSLTGGAMMFSSGTLLNRSSGVVNVSIPSILNVGSSLISNFGTMNFSTTGFGTLVVVNVPVVNSGTITSMSGTLGIGSSGLIHNGGSVLRGPGAFDFSGWQMLSGGATTFAGANMVLNGYIFGPGHLNLTGNLHWNSGTIGGAGSVGGGAMMTVAPGGVLNIGATGSFVSRTLGRTLDNSGVINIHSGTLGFSIATLNNQPDGVINLMAGSFNGVNLAPTSTNAGLLTNQGTINSIGPNMTSILVPVVNSGTIIANGGTLLFEGIAGFSTFTHSAGSTLAGPGRIDLGSISTAATHVVSGTTRFAGGNINLNGGSVIGAGDIIVSGALNWNAGTIAGTGSASAAMNIASGGVLNLPASSAPRFLSRTIQNSGQFNFAGGTLSFGSFGAINNLPDGVLNLNAAATFVATGATPPLISNQGLINVYPSGSFSSAIGSLLNSGTLMVHGGTLNFGSNVTHSAGSTIAGTGWIDLGGAQGTASQTLNGTTYFNGTNINMLSPAVSIVGPGALVLNGTFNWANGTISGTGTTSAVMTIATGGVLDLTGTFTSGRTLNRTINNSGVINFNTGTIGTGILAIGSQGLINNLANGVMNLNRGATLNSFSGLNPFLFNSGTIHVLAGAGSVQFATFAINGGTITANTGTLNLGSQFSSATLTHNGGSVLNGPGTIEFGAGTQLFNGDATLAGTNMIAGTAAARFLGPGHLTLSGNLDWRGGIVEGAGAMTIAGTGRLDLGLQTGTRLLTRQTDSFGLIDFSAGSLLLGTTLTNRAGATINIASPQNFLASGGSALLINEGTMNLANGSIGITVPFVNLGVVNVLGSATLTNFSGSFTVLGQVHGTTNNQAIVTLGGAARMDAIDGTGQVIVATDANTTATRVRQSRLTLGASSTLQIEPKGDADGVSIIGQFIAPPGARFDLTDNGLVYDFAATSDGTAELAAVRDWVAVGQLTSSLGIGVRRLASVNNMTFGAGQFMGIAVDPSSILVKYTWAGDADLSGAVDIRDLYQLALNWQSTSAVWTSGDFNYDNVVDTIDLDLLTSNWHAGAATLSEALAGLGLPHGSLPDPAGAAAILALYALRIRSRPPIR